MTAPTVGDRGASAAAAAALAAGRSATMSSQERATLAARFTKVRDDVLCPNCLEADDGTAVKGSLSLAPAQSQPHRPYSSPLRLHCATCKRHLQSDKTFRCIVVTAELTAPTDRTTDTVCTADQSTNLSEQVALLTTGMQKVTDENERLRARISTMTQMNPTDTDASENSPVVRLVRDLIAQQPTVTVDNSVAAEARATANESAAQVEKLAKTVNDSTEAVATLAETINELSSPRPNQANANRIPPGGNNETQVAPVCVPVANKDSRPSFAEIAKRNLPQGVTLNEDYEGVMERNAREFQQRFVRPTMPTRAPHFEIPSTALKPIYGSGLKHQPIGEILRGFRSLLPPQATRGISLFGTSSFELPVEESVEKHAREILKQMGMRLNDQTDPFAFDYPSGSPVTEKEQ